MTNDKAEKVYYQADLVSLHYTEFLKVIDE